MRWCWGRSLYKAVGAVLLMAAVAGCARGSRRPVRITDHRAYLLSEVPEQFDLTALAGRHIVIDPGHGGPWPGAVGPNGVREADVNLGVALHLWGLLTEAGAQVELTRTTDSHVSNLPQPTLKQDLQARAEFATTRNPDAFISVHHNADIISGSKKNDLETYYQLRGGDASLDLAQAIHRHHARNLGERSNAIRPGNFHVLRETPVSAILGESSYISSEANAEHLAFAAMQRLEAEAYFLGLVEYFSRGVPQVVEITPAGDARLASVDAVEVQFGLDRGVPLDPATIRIALNGKPIPADYDPDTQRARAAIPTTLASGRYRVGVRARNVRGNAARTSGSTFTVDTPPQFIGVAMTPRALGPGGDGRAIMTVRVLDAAGHPVLDGTPVTFTAAAGTLDRTEARTIDGVATANWLTQAPAAGATLTAQSGDVSGAVRILLEESAPPTQLVQVVRAETGAPILGARFIAGAPVTASNHDGYAVVPRDAATTTVHAAGYWPAELVFAGDGPDTLRVMLVPVTEGVLHGEVIAIDAADGGAAGGARGPTGLRGADVNARVARYLANYVRTAGGTPVFTRTGDESVAAFHRVEISEAAGAARFVSIRHGAGTPPGRVLDETGHATQADLTRGVVVEHYPTSVAGKRLAGFLRESLADVFPRARMRVVQSVAYELTHTGCPAVRVQALSPVDAEDEITLSTPGVQRRVAYALFHALARDFGAHPEMFGAVAGRVEDVRGRPVEGATVRVLGLWLAVTDREGRFAFDFLPPGEVVLEVDGAGGTRRTLRVPVAAGAVAPVVIRADESTAG